VSGDELFDQKVCMGCQVRARCTRSKTGPRELTLHPKEQHLALQAARERQQTDDFKERYKRRAGNEGTMSQAAFSLGMRRTRYRGLRKTHFHHIATVIAINLQRVSIGYGESRVLARAYHILLDLRRLPDSPTTSMCAVPSMGLSAAAGDTIHF
jgi:Transposase DDE domain